MIARRLRTKIGCMAKVGVMRFGVAKIMPVNGYCELQDEVGGGLRMVVTTTREPASDVEQTPILYRPFLYISLAGLLNTRNVP